MNAVRFHLAGLFSFQNDLRWLPAMLGPQPLPPCRATAHHIQGVPGLQADGPSPSLGCGRLSTTAPQAPCAACKRRAPPSAAPLPPPSTSSLPAQGVASSSAHPSPLQDCALGQGRPQLDLHSLHTTLYLQTCSLAARANDRYTLSLYLGHLAHSRHKINSKQMCERWRLQSTAASSWERAADFCEDGG